MPVVTVEDVDAHAPTDTGMIVQRGEDAPRPVRLRAFVEQGDVEQAIVEVVGQHVDVLPLGQPFVLARLRAEVQSVPAEGRRA